SLFERLCTARTRSGEETLASWLLAPATPEVIRERHEAVAELRRRLDLREDLELLGTDVRSGIDPVALAEWGKAPRSFPGKGVQISALLLAVLGMFTLLGWAFFGTGLLPFLAAMAVEAAFATCLVRRVKLVLWTVDRRGHDLVLLSELLDRLEREPFQSALLGRLRQMLETQGHPASVQIRRLGRLIHLLDARRHQLFAALADVLLGGTQFAMAIDAWRGAEGPAIALWLRAIGEFEALCSLAAYAAENSADPFPEFVTEMAAFDAEGLGHPLIPVASCV